MKIHKRIVFVFFMSIFFIAYIKTDINKYNYKIHKEGDTKILSTSANIKLNPHEAIDIVRNYTQTSGNIKFEYDHISNKNGVDYFVIRAYENIGIHISTIGWYFVDVNTGNAFEWNLIEDKLIPLT